MQLACDHEAVAAVVAFAADRADGLEVEMFAGEVSHSGSGVLHQGQRGDAVLLRGETVDLAHFRSGNDFHDMEGTDCMASASSLASCGGSPRTIR
jgi:hypothetical protein